MENFVPLRRSRFEPEGRSQMGLERFSIVGKRGITKERKAKESKKNVKVAKAFREMLCW